VYFLNQESGFELKYGIRDPIFLDQNLDFSFGIGITVTQILVDQGSESNEN